MRELLFHLRKALETAICSGTPQLSLDVAVFDRDRASDEALAATIATLLTIASPSANVDIISRVMST